MFVRSYARDEADHPQLMKSSDAVFRIETVDHPVELNVIPVFGVRPGPRASCIGTTSNTLSAGSRSVKVRHQIRWGLFSRIQLWLLPRRKGGLRVWQKLHAE